MLVVFALSGACAPPCVELERDLKTYSPEQPLGVEYRVTTEPGTHDGPETVEERLLLWRSPRVVIYEYLDRGVSDYWVRIAENRYELERRVHQEGVAFLYSQGDDENLGRSHTWRTISHLVEPPSDPGDTGSWHCLPSRASSAADAATRRLVWSEELALPLLFELRNEQAVRFEMIRVFSASAAEKAFSRSHDFRTVDWVDLGDLEADEQVRRALRLLEPFAARPLHRH